MVLLLMVVWLTGMASTAMAGDDPMSTIRNPIDKVITILNDPQYRAPGQESRQRDAIWDTMIPIFDFTEISQRTVAQHWNTFSDKEKSDFSDIFSRFLGNIYIDKIQGEYHDEKVQYLEQNFHGDIYAEVKTLILRQTTQIPVNYRMLKNNAGQWRIYDIVIEGVSLVKNYRSQFASLLQKNKPTDLIRILHEKVAHHETELVKPQPEKQKK